MIALVIWPLVFAVVGALMYVLASKPQLAEIGRLIFFAGFLVLTWVLAGSAIHFPPR